MSMTFLREVDADGIVHRLQRDVLGNLRVRPVEDFQRVEHLAAAVALAVDYDVGQGRAETEAAGDRTVRDAGNLGLRLDVLVDVHLDGFNLPRLGMAVIVREVHAAEELARVGLSISFFTCSSVQSGCTSSTCFRMSFQYWLGAWTT